MTKRKGQENQLKDVLLAIATCRDQKKLFRTIISYLTTSIPNAGCSIFQVDHSTNQLIMVASSTILEDKFCECSYEPGEGFTGWVFQERKLLHIPFLKGDYDLAEIEPTPIHRGTKGNKPCETESVGPFLAAPIMSKGYVIGVIRMPCTRETGSEVGQDGRSKFSDAQVQLFERFAERLSESMDFANQTQKQEQLVQTYSKLGELKQLENLDSVVKDIPKIVGGGGCSIFLIKDFVAGEPKKFVLSASTSATQEFQEYRKRTKEYRYEENGSGLTAWVATTGSPIMLENINDMHAISILKHNKYSARHENGPCEIRDVGPFLAVPIKFEEDTIGVIRIPRRKGSKPFEEIDKTLLIAFADHLGLIIEKIKKKQATEALRTSKQKEFDKLFPPLLLGMVNNISHLDYSDELKTFSKIPIFDNDIKDEVSTLLRSLWTKKYKQKYSFSLIMDFKDYEELLFQMPGYRDHFYHQLQVFLLGSVLIDGLNKNNKLFDRSYNRALCLKEDDNLSAGLAWMIASTFHDVAYPIEKSHVLFNLFFEKFMDLKNIVQDRLHLDQILTKRYYINLIHQLCDFHSFLSMPKKDSCWQSQPFDKKQISIDSLFETGLLKCLLENKDHGALGSLMLLYKSQVKQHEYNNIILPAALSIALHKRLLFETREKLKFEQNPLAFLLVYCDLVQEWGRHSSGKPNIHDLDEIKIEKSHDGKSVITTSITVGDHRLAHKKAEEADHVYKRIQSNEVDFRFTINDINDANYSSFS